MREMKDLTPKYAYSRLVEEEREHFSAVEVTGDLTAGGGHASAAWRHYWERVGEDLRPSPFADITGYLECAHGGTGRPIRILSLGSGHCGQEIAMARRFRRQCEITCTDINQELFGEARRRAAEGGLPLCFEKADLNFMTIAPGAYDMVFAHAILHHVINQESLFDQISAGLAPGGILHVVDVTGKNRRLLWDENERFANKALALLPREVTGGLRLEVPRTKKGMEGVRQAEILPILRQRFETLFEHLHGAFMRFVCTDERLARCLNPKDPGRRRYLDLLTDIDRSAVANGILRPLEIWGVYRPRCR